MLPRRSWPICLTVAAALSQQFTTAADEPQPKQTLITISEETTVLTEPLGEDGFVDYLEAVNARLSEGVTPENNAAVLLRAALGLMEAKGNQEYRDQYDRMLGIEPAGEGIYVQLIEVARQEGNDDVEKAYDLLASAHKLPWTADEYPTIAKWLSANAAALEMVVEATRQPRFYTPYIASEGASPKLVSVLLPALQETREAARALLARAMWHAGEGDLAKAFDDLEAIHRLARLVSQDATIVGGLVGIAIDGLADQGDVALVSKGLHTPEQLAAYLERLNKLPPFPPMADRLDNMERLMFADVVVSLARGQVDEEALGMMGASKGFAGILQQLPRFMVGSIDWDAMLRDANGWYDRIVSAMEEDTYAEQQAALQSLEADIVSLAEGAKSPLRLAAIVLSDNQTRGHLVGKQLSDALVALLLPAVRAASSAEHRGQMKFDLARLAVALEVYRAQTGEYPESLAALTLDILKEIPQDRFNNQPLRYEVKNDGYLLYSVGMNGEDDNATSIYSSTKDGEHVPEGQVDGNAGDDLVVRVPLP